MITSWYIRVHLSSLDYNTLSITDFEEIIYYVVIGLRKRLGGKELCQPPESKSDTWLTVSKETATGDEFCHSMNGVGS